MAERLQNTANSYIGGAKQSLGETLGNERMAAEGAAQKTQADTAQKVADAKTHAEGVGNKIQGKAQQTVGSITGDTSMQAKGHANEALGDAQRTV
ncbi:hypothetical protein BGW38_005752 [Lunasporangiospora selenospora]|uniref:CsbD-like domain-containing protein n=1 Tax=Lunasporangiospora selenospora TaxID=979761 RepID=A0A9P6KB51_9FUNG|nr:hypothetical protein BGW38_005752 [Lunasporangiospora selenospora]